MALLLGKNNFAVLLSLAYFKDGSVPYIKHYLCSFILALFFLSVGGVNADSWLDKIKSGYQKVEDTIKGDDNSKSKTALALAKPLPTLSPTNWHYSYFNEPVFNSQLVVLEAGSSHQDTLVFVHGLGEFGMKDWFDVIPALTERYHVIALDLPGFGLSAAPKGRYTPTNFARVLDTVVSQYVSKPFTLIGHSMGGAVSLRYASIYPDKVNKLILVNAAGILEKTAFVKHLSEIPSDESVIPKLFQKTLAQLNDFGASLVELGNLHDPASDFLQGNDATWNALISNSPNLNAALSLVEEDFNQAIRELEVETDIIWGEKDTVAPLRTAKVLNANIKYSRLSVIQNAPHVPMKSHYSEFMTLLNQALNPINNNKHSGVNEGSQGHLRCDKKANMVYTGTFDTIVLNRCTNIKLKGVTANYLEVNDSLVEAEDLVLNGELEAMTATESVIRITNAVIVADRAISLSGSRLDLAGVDIIGKRYALYSDKHSQVVLSISQSKGHKYKGLAHGLYEVTEQTLDSLLVSEEAIRLGRSL